MTSFADHFSQVSASYAQFRPRYPAPLFAFLAGICHHRDAAWDCATGSGQAAGDLAPHFARVWATDASASQISHAQPHPRVQYRVAPAEESGLDDLSVDLVTVAQALHWFDRPAFYREVKRVLRPGGILAAWCYGQFRLDEPDLDGALHRFYHQVVGPYWPPERALVEAGYATLDFPFDRLQTPRFDMTLEVSLDTLAGYLGTWSATQRYIAAQKHDPLPELIDYLRPVWGADDTRRQVTWPLGLIVGAND
jgi:SAM-dependent methyltransferase